MNDFERIQKVIEFISSKFKEQPNLDELANLVNLSPYHFHHLFRRWVGISPKRFLQYVTCDYAKKLLDESQDILAVSLESGLSGPSRLHDLFVNIEAVSQNPIAFLIPCHRVIKEIGDTGGYRWGITRKKAIIGWEAARKDALVHQY